MEDAKQEQRTRRGNGKWSYTQRTDGLWTSRKMVRRNANGKPNIVAFYGTKAEVKRKAEEFDKKTQVGRPASDKQTFAEHYMNWMKVYKRPSLKPTSYDNLEFCFEARIKPYVYLSQAQLHQVDTALLQRYFTELSYTQKYSYATIRKTYQSINNFFTKLVKLKIVSSNPMSDVELVQESHLEKKTKQIDFFDDEDIQALITESQKTTGDSRKEYETSKYYHPVCAPCYRYGDHIIFLLFTGLRIGEALGLRWKDVDLENKMLHISNNLSFVYSRNADGDREKLQKAEGSTKTSSGMRDIPLSNTAFEALKRIKLRSRQTDSGDYVFQSETGRTPSNRNIRRTLNTMQAHAKTKTQNSGLHVLRHSFASMLIRKGVDIKIVSALLGHSKVSTTYDIYVSLLPKQTKDAVSVLDTI